MRVKLNRGPMKGQYFEVQDDGSTEVRVSEPIPWTFADFQRTGMNFSPVRKEGSYRKSNVKLKNGAWVYEWMGWYG